MKKTLLGLILCCTTLITLSQTKGSECEKSVVSAMQLVQQGKYAESIHPLESALKICSRDSGMSDKDYYYMLGVLTQSYFNAKQTDSAIKRGEPVAGFFERTKQTTDPMYYKVMLMLGHSYAAKERFLAAVECLEIALPYYKKQQTTLKEKEFYLLTALVLAENYANASMYEKSMALNASLFPSILEYAGKNVPLYSRIRTNMGNDYLRIGLYDSALTCYKEALLVSEGLFGKNHVSYAEGLSNLGGAYQQQGLYANAVPLFEESVNILENNKATNTTTYGEILGKLGQCYFNLGYEDKSQQMLITSVQTLRRVIGHDYHIKVIRGIANLAYWYKNVTGANDTILRFAVNAFHHVKGLMEKIKFIENSEYATLLSNIGDTYTDLKKYDSAIHFLNQSLTLKQKLKTNNSDDYAVTLGNMAAAYKEAGKFDQAIQYYQQTISLLKGLYGEHYPSVSTTIGNLALAYYTMNDFQKADSLLKYQYNLEKKYVLENTEGLSETEKEGYALTLRLIGFMASSIRHNNKANVANDWVVNNSLFYKGLLLESSRGLTTAFSKLTDPAAKKSAQEFLTLRTAIGKELLKPLASRSKSLGEMETRANSLERELSGKSGEYRNWKEQFSIDWRNVQQNLKDGEVAIEFTNYNLLKDRFDRTSSEYAALIIRKDKPEPQFVHLFSDKALDKLISKSSSQEAVVKKLYRSTIKSASSQPQPSDSLYHLIWKPLLPHLKDVKSIYFSADGVINNLNLAAIIKPDGKRLVEDYEFVQLSSTRNMLKKNPQPTFSNIELWGGVQYDGSNTSQTRSAAFTYLPGTLTEITDIVSTAKSSGKQAKTFVAAQANESAFKNMNGKSPEVLHIATHGFFFPEPSKETKQADNRFAQSENPLLRSGLALANANANWQNSDVAADKEDGILTAYEIADMDLSNTKLVVLSACETGLGDVKSGEGVYGLQRAFKMAGVNYLIMSLWQVPDLETKEFMQTFYKHCLAGMPIRKAFRETQLAMNQKYQPYQWAAFVLVE